MHKRLLLLGIISFGWIPGTQADDAVKGSKNKASLQSISPSSSDKSAGADADYTLIINGSDNSTISDADSSIDFKDLFVATSMGSSNGVKLNPRALSFVLDYMENYLK